MPVDPSSAGAAVGGTASASGASGTSSKPSASSQSSSPTSQTPGQVAVGMGALQMAVGFAQLRRAKRLPFPGYMATKGPLAEMKSLYQSQMNEGIGSEQSGIMRMAGAQTMGQQMNAVAQNASQSSQLFGRTAALNRTGNEARIANANFEAKQSAMSGVERMNTAMTAIEQKDIAAARDYRLTAERAAGAAIKRGSENIAGYVSEENYYKRSGKEKQA